ncbi:MAG: hypothetical protein WCO91_06005, partial [Gemmataceae bacterium]
MRYLALIAFYCCCGSLCQGTSLAAEDSKEALQKLQEFVGQWKASGGPDGRNKVVPIWSETIEW